MKKASLVIVAVNLIVLLLACSEGVPASKESYSPTLSPKPAWLVRWLNKPICQPPCWENITPGKTSFMEALEIVKAISDAKVIYIGDDNIRLKSNHYDAYNFALLLSLGDTNIQNIGLITRYTSLELSEIVERYGFPDEMLKYSVYSQEFNSHSIDLLYYDLGMVISFNPMVNDLSNKVSLDSNIKVGAISFYTPQLENYFSVPAQYGTNVSPAIKLNGYGDYDIPEGERSPINTP